MTACDKSDELVALEQARAELEAGLSRDADWLALRHSRQAGAAANGDSGRSLRDARLERALAGNPLYTAWRLVSEAIEVVRAGQAGQHETKVENIEQPQVVEPSGDPDDLTRIRGIRPALARRLAEFGITRYCEIAAWRPGDVRAVSDALGLGRDISRQNWIEQAALLDLRARGASAGDAGQPRERAVDLPDILDHIRSSAPASVALEQASPPAQELALPVAQPSVNGALPHSAMTDEPGPLTESSPPRQAAAADLIPAVAHVNTADRLQRLEEELLQFSETVRASSPDQGMPAWEAPLTSEDVAMLDGSGPSARAEPEFRPASESDEATVTFVVRAPPPSIPSVAESHADPGADTELPMLDPPRGLQPSPVLSAEPTAAPNGLAEEAEVVIIRPDAARTIEPPPEQGGGSVRRFLRSLTGT